VKLSLERLGLLSEKPARGNAPVQGTCDACCNPSIRKFGDFQREFDVRLSTDRKGLLVCNRAARPAASGRSCDFGLARQFSCGSPLISCDSPLSVSNLVSCDRHASELSRNSLANAKSRQKITSRTHRLNHSVLQDTHFRPI